MKAVILAGGLGTRLRPLTNNKPKPMLPVGEKPILEHLIEWTKKGGIKSIVICVSYLKESIEEYFGDGSKFGVSIEYAISKKPLATAGQLKTAEKFIDDDFVCMYGDSIFNFSLRSMIKQHTTKKPMVTMSLNEYKIPKNKSYGMDDVIKKAMKKKQSVQSFVTKKGFTDIGNKESYMQACKEYEQKQKRISK